MDLDIGVELEGDGATERDTRYLIIRHGIRGSEDYPPFPISVSFPFIRLLDALRFASVLQNACAHGRTTTRTRTHTHTHTHTHTQVAPAKEQE